MNTTSKAGNWKKSPGIAGNGPQIDEAGKMSNDQSKVESRARSGKAAIFDGIAPRLIALGRQEAARRGISFPELISGYLRTFRPDHLLYREVLRKLVARNNEDLQEEKELHRDYARQAGGRKAGSAYVAASSVGRVSAG